MRHVTKNFCRITFLDSYKNVYDKSAANENVLAKNIITRSSAITTFVNFFQVLKSLNRIHYDLSL